jgi:calcyclin binding protein
VSIPLADLDDLLQLSLTPSLRPNTQSVLRDAIAAARGKVAAHASVPVAPVPVAPVPVAPVPTSSTTSTSTSYAPIVKFGWEQTGDHVCVLAYDLPGVGALAKERPDAVTCSFERDAFDLIVRGLGGRDHRLRVTSLSKDIVPEQSGFKVKKGSVEVRLRKGGNFEHWVELSGKRARKAAGGGPSAAASDPTAGIMDLMRDMYEEGDETTRKIIGESMIKSREEQMKGAGAGAGAGRGTKGASSPFGGLGDLDDDF